MCIRDRCKPGLEVQLAKLGGSERNQGLVIDERAEVPGLGVDDHRSLITDSGEVALDEIAHRLLLGPCDFDGSVLGRSGCRLSDEVCNIVRSDWLERAMRYVDPPIDSRAIGDPPQELQELGGPNDRVRDTALLDEVFLSDLGPEVTVLR